jgi:segregation and condensation protein B
METSESEKAIEAILFASGDAVEIRDIAQAIDSDEKSTKKIIDTLKDKYESEKRGIKIIYVENAVQMCTNSDYFAYIRKICTLPKKRMLTAPMLETLAIIAYKQPVTKVEIEAIRRVNVDRIVNTLIKYNLIKEVGRLNTAGRPMLFGTSDEFLRHFGFSSIKELPELKIDERDRFEIESKFGSEE